MKFNRLFVPLAGVALISTVFAIVGDIRNENQLVNDFVAAATGSQIRDVYSPLKLPVFLQAESSVITARTSKESSDGHLAIAIQEFCKEHTPLNTNLQSELATNGRAGGYTWSVTDTTDGDNRVRTIRYKQLDQDRR